MNEFKNGCGCPAPAAKIPSRIIVMGALRFQVSQCARCERRIIGARICADGERGGPCPINDGNYDHG